MNSADFYDGLNATRNTLKDRIEYCKNKMDSKYASIESKRYWKNNMLLFKNAFEALDLIFQLEY